MIRVTHIITGLSTGGAEMMLYRLLSTIDSRRVESNLISLTTMGTLGERIKALGVEVRALGMRRGLQDAARLITLTRWLRAEKPDVIQTWMYHANLAGGVAAFLAGGAPVIWNIRAGGDGFGGYRKSTIMTVKIGTILSRILPERIVFNSAAAQRVHSRMGYTCNRVIVIPNGFDTSAFRPRLGAPVELRQELRIDDSSPLIGLVARFHPQKGHSDFIRAGAMLLESGYDADFVLCGPGVTPGNAMLASLRAATGHPERFHLLGERDDMAYLTAALDVANSTSTHGEGFSNTIGEAMASGVPCVVTDVSDSSVIVGETGIVVPPQRPDLLAAAWIRLLQMGERGRTQLGTAARSRIEALYNLPNIAERYLMLYEEVSRGVGPDGRQRRKLG